MSDETAKTPEWMLLLENKKKRPHRLAHDIGAGALCLSCGDACPGLDLHFWRKLCRNCKCKKEEHDVRDDEGYEQFEILFSSSGCGKKRRTGALLNINIPETTASVKNPVRDKETRGSKTVGNKKSVAFDWVPPDVPEEVAAEYMQQLPATKLPISGSDGALYRRQQLEKQVPLHDLDATKCHGLSPDEILGHQKYLENLKNNVVGQGRVTKIPILYKEQLLSYSGPSQHQSEIIAQSALSGESRPLRIATSQSAQCLKSLPSIPLPRPFTAHSYNRNEDIPPPLPDTLPPAGAAVLGLKKPSSFLPSSYHTAPHLGGSADAKVLYNKQDRDLAHSSEVPHSLGFAQPRTGSHRPAFGDNVGTETDPRDSKVPDAYGGNRGQLTGTQVHASDAVFRSDQQAQDIAYSTELPNTLVTQQTQTLHGSKPPVAQSPGGSRVSPTSHSNGGNSLVPSDRGQITRDSDAQAAPMITNVENVETLLGPSSGADPLAQDGVVYRNYNPAQVAYSDLGPSSRALHSHPQNPNTALPSTSLQPQNNGVHPPNAALTHSDAVTAPPDGVASGNWSAPFIPPGRHTAPQDAAFMPYSANVPGHIVHSTAIAGDSMPKSAHMMKQKHAVSQEEFDPRIVDHELAGKLQHVTNLGDDDSQEEAYYMNCHKCSHKLMAGEVAVMAERAGKQAAWHPQCFVCCTCQELLVDLIYFYYKNDVYCGRHYAELLDIPRCFACDELIFVKEYTCAEGKAFHVKHFCCYDCDVPLGGKQYILKDEQPVCLECYQKKYGKSCHTCKMAIAAGDHRVGWKDLSWHVSPNCFCCSKCLKSLLGGKFLVKSEKPFCSKECAQAAV